MQYRRRLRTRIILSFLVLGFGLTALFAASSLYLRTRLEGQLIDDTLQKEVDSLVKQARMNPSELPSISLYSAKTWSERTAYKMPLFYRVLIPASIIFPSWTKTESCGSTNTLFVATKIWSAMFVTTLPALPWASSRCCLRWQYLQEQEQAGSVTAGPTIYPLRRCGLHCTTHM